MKFNDRHITTIENLQKTLLKVTIPESNGEEYLSFAQGFYFLEELRRDIKEAIELERQRQAAVQQATAAQATPHIGDTTSNGKVTTKPAKKTSKATK